MTSSWQPKGSALGQALLSSLTRRRVVARSTPPTAGVGGTTHVHLDGVRIAYSRRRVFDSLTCGFPRGRISVILGGSGSGKSTILRLIAGLIHPDAGHVYVDGQDITRLSERGLYHVRQKLGMLFQGGALLDSYNVFENLALPLRERTHMTSSEVADEVHAALRAVGVTDVDQLLPGQLSGGMLRRVALARAVIRKPVILLCDEPFSGLDPVSLKRIESLLLGLNREFGITLIIVSHHVPSTLRMADNVLLLLGDRTVTGLPQELRDSSDPEVADFFDEGLDSPHEKRTP
jgi:phospholipid/cholesterol/gamma-HCH transport system ATP-binding protein